MKTGYRFPRAKQQEIDVSGEISTATAELFSDRLGELFLISFDIK
ncbi:MAG: hypothetical protein ACYSR7_03790 [Planctomycetota bacterium]|jgi:hypothetical protein